MDWKKKVEDTFDIVAEPATNIVSSMFLEGLVGSVVPGVTSAMLAYKQKRSERMIEEFMIETQKRQEEFEEKLLNADESRVKEITGKYFGITLDYVSNTKQEEKVEYLVNGFINLASVEFLQEDVILIYYDLLEELNLLDIRVLRLFAYQVDDSYSKIIDDAGIDYDQYHLIINKLVRLGLLQSRAQANYDDMFINVMNIAVHLEKLQKGEESKLKFKKPIGLSTSASSISSKRVTPLGRKLIEFFLEKNE